MTRRKFLKDAGAAAVLGVVGMPYLAFGAGRKVVVVGGGIGGATAAKYIRLADPGIEVTLIEPNTEYFTCFMSNEVLSGGRSIDSIRFGYAGLERHGVTLVHDKVTKISASNRAVLTEGGNSFPYDRCIVAPGIDFIWDSIEGYDAKVAEEIPHAWKAGSQTKILRSQLEAMEDGGTVIIAPPPNPFRCPAAPYERASQIAHYLKRQKPKSKVLILDPKVEFSQMELFTQAWRRLYGYESDDSLIEWHGGEEAAGVVKVDAATRTVTTAFDEEYQGDVLNIIPAQKAGDIAFVAGLTNDAGWCPVDLVTFESKLQKGIHVIGDACFTQGAKRPGLPKSGTAANTEAKICAAAVVALLNEKQPGEASYTNACYSILGEDYAISLSGQYRLSEDRSELVKTSGTLTPMDAAAEQHAGEVALAHHWFDSITADVFK